MELGVDVKIMGEIVGYQSDTVTRRYRPVSSAAARETMDKIGSHFYLSDAGWRMRKFCSRSRYASALCQDCGCCCASGPR